MANLGIFGNMDCDENIVSIILELKSKGKQDVEIIDVLGRYESDGYVISTTNKDKIKNPNFSFWVFN